MNPKAQWLPAVSRVCSSIQILVPKPLQFFAFVAVRADAPSLHNFVALAQFLDVAREEMIQACVEFSNAISCQLVPIS